MQTIKGLEIFSFVINGIMLLCYDFDLGINLKVFLTVDFVLSVMLTITWFRRTEVKCTTKL